MPARQEKKKAKRRAKYVKTRDDVLDSARAELQSKAWKEAGLSTWKLSSRAWKETDLTTRKVSRCD